MNTTSVPIDDAEALFKPFEWVYQKHQRGPYDMISDVRDLAAGTALVLQLVERSDLQREVGEAPILDRCDTGRMHRMAIAAMQMVTGRIDTYFEHLKDPASPVRETEHGSAA